MTFQAAMLIFASTGFAARQADSLDVTSPLPFSKEEESESEGLPFIKIGGLEISGYIHAQWAYCNTTLEDEIPAYTSNCNTEFSENMNNLFRVRRAKFKFFYQNRNVTYVLMTDFTEKEVRILDGYLKYTTPNHLFAFQAGIFFIPFGFEVDYPSSKRESVERSRVITVCFPAYRDPGAKITLRGTSGWLSQFALDLSVCNGNGIGYESDSYKNAVGRLTWSRDFAATNLGFAASGYFGGIVHTTDSNYVFKKGLGFEHRDVAVGDAQKRRHYALSGKLTRDDKVWGATNLMAEYVWGRQPGNISMNSNPGRGTSVTGNLYNRNFAGYYVMLAQDIGKTKHTMMLKYDYFDPNTRIRGNEIGRLAGTGAADIAYRCFSLGYLFRCNDNLKFTLQYDMNDNERTSASFNGAIFNRHIKHDVLTVRAQVRF